MFLPTLPTLYTKPPLALAFTHRHLDHFRRCSIWSIGPFLPYRPPPKAEPDPASFVHDFSFLSLPLSRAMTQFLPLFLKAIEVGKNLGEFPADSHLVASLSVFFPRHLPSFAIINHRLVPTLPVDRYFLFSTPPLFMHSCPIRLTLFPISLRRTQEPTPSSPPGFLPIVLPMCF